MSIRIQAALFFSAIALASAGGAALEFSVGRDFAGGALVLACLGMVYSLWGVWRSRGAPLRQKDR